MNSVYGYLLLCLHHAPTCVVAEQDGAVVGFVLAYRPPMQPKVVFVWQVAVLWEARGLGLAKRMLKTLLERDACRQARFLETTVTPSNTASQALFRSLAAVEAGRVDAFAGTSLTVQDMLDKRKSDRIERAEPFHDPVIDGEEVRGYGAFGFRKEDADLVEAFNRELAGFIGSNEHLALVRPFGFTARELPGDRTAEELCQF